MNELDAYVYALVELPINKVFYIGMAREKRGKKERFNEHIRKVEQGSPSHVHRYMRQIISTGRDIEFRILRDKLSYETAMQVERDWIEKIGLDNLLNTYRGGHDGRWKNVSEETKAEYRLKNQQSQNCVKVIVEAPDGSTQEFPSISAAARHLGVSSQGQVQYALVNNYRVRGHRVEYKSSIDQVNNNFRDLL